MNSEKKRDGQQEPNEKIQGKQDDTASESGDLLDMNQAIEALKTTRSTFYRWLRAGKLKGMKIGRQWRFYQKEIDRFLKGEEPTIELTADINPLLKTINGHLTELTSSSHHSDKAIEEKSLVIATVNQMLALGHELKASDLHLEPHMKETLVSPTGILRYRIDGVLHTYAEFDPRLLSPLIERFKILSALDPHVKNRPQDGRILLKINFQRVDLRVCVVMSSTGESIVARFLCADTIDKRLKINSLDFSTETAGLLQKHAGSPWGLIVVTGPTGSGKTTTLYAALNEVAGPNVKTMTAEDPVEFVLPWVNHLQANNREGISLPGLARTIMRSDPDVVMVGEVRDYETLDIIHKIALTGHLVLTTLHTLDTPAALRRLLDMGSSPYVIGESVKLVVAQHLVRRLCPHCSEKADLPDDFLYTVKKRAEKGGLKEGEGGGGIRWTFKKPVGCERCSNIGFKGRVPIAEALEMSLELFSALRRNASTDEIRCIAVGQGMTTMLADGIRAAANGVTSLSEIMRVFGNGWRC